MLNRRENVIVEKSERFADRIVKMHKYLAKKREGNSDILKQVVRSGTSVGANVSESKFAKEANETKYWIDRLFAGGYLSDMEHDSIIKDNEEIISILVKITGTLKQRMQK